MANLAPLLSRICAKPGTFGRKPIIRGVRISVELSLSLLAEGKSAEAILDNYPDVEPDEIPPCLIRTHPALMCAVRIIEGLDCKSRGGTHLFLCPGGEREDIKDS